MVQWNVDSISVANPSELSAQEKDDLYESLAWLEIKDLPTEKYESLFIVTKEVMKYKGEQVESLLADLDILTNNTVGGNEELQEEISKANKQIEVLLEEVEVKNKDLEQERLQVEKLLSELAELQREKTELRREITMIQSEGHSSGLIANDSSDDTPHLKEMVQHKNKHILQLLSDIQILEKENELLNEKLTLLRRELSEATANLEKFSGENISLRQNNQEFLERINILEEKNSALSSQASELVDERNKREANLDILIDALEERVTKWQEIISRKDEEVTELRAKLNETAEISATKGSMMFTANYLELTKTIEEQEEAIKKLHDQLKQATEDMSNCSIQVQELKQKAEIKDASDNGSKTLEELQEELEKAQNQIHYLHEKANDAEQDAQFRAEEMTELIIQLKEYEEGVYGLSEARSQVKELKRQLKTRDNQIIKLIEQINHLTFQAGDEEQIDLENFEKYFDSEDQTSHLDLQTQLNAIQQTAINLSMQNFELRTEIVKLKEDKKRKDDVKEVSTDSTDNGDLKEKLKAAIEENESLRKGLHEILECIQNQDGSRSFVIESECLENLLEALDARHISGWYHPAMRIQAALNKMQGNNDALRQELRESRLRESYFQAELQRSMIQVGELQDQLKKYYIPEHHTPVPAPRRQIGSVNEKRDKSNTNSRNPTPPVEEEKPPDEEVDGLEAGDIIKISDVRVGEYLDQSCQTQLVTFSNANVQTDLHWADIHLSPSDFTAGSSDHPITKNDVELSDENDNKVSFKESKVLDQNDSKTTDKDIESNGAVIDSAKIKISTSPKKNELQKSESLETESNGSPKIKDKLSKIENDLKKKCDDLKAEFDVIKTLNESSIHELQKIKQELFSEVEKALLNVNEEIKKIKETESSKPTVNSFTLGAFQEQEAKLLSYGIELGELRRGLTEKENYITFLETKIKETNEKAKEVSGRQQEQEEKRVKTLKETLSGLQQIVSQKEATCQRYKALLEESNLEYGKLLEKYHTLERSLSTGPTHRDPIAESRSVSILMEKWISRVRGLESEIDGLNRQVADLTNDLDSSKKEAEHWKLYSETLKEKTVDQCALDNNRREIEELRLHMKEIKEEAEIGFQNRIRSDHAKFKEKEDDYKRLIKSQENELAKLKHQLNLRSTKSSTKTVKKEVVLLDKIKCLEDEIEKLKERERSQLQMRRDKCSDEVSKWEEKKRLQMSNEKYRQELKEKTNLMEQMEGQISRLKVIIARMERERISLKRRLKTSDGLLAKSMSVEEKMLDYDDKSFITESRFETPVLDSTPRSPAESVASELHDPKIKAQSRRDLVRAISALKKVISKLRSEHSNYYHKDYVEQLQTELRKMENNYMDAVERSLALEEQIRESETKMCGGDTYIVESSEDRSEVGYLKELLAQKCSLLMKVKVLLQRALLREKQLIHQVTLLEKLVPPEKLARLHEEAREM